MNETRHSQTPSHSGLNSPSRLPFPSVKPVADEPKQAHRSSARKGSNHQSQPSSHHQSNLYSFKSLRTLHARESRESPQASTDRLNPNSRISVNLNQAATSGKGRNPQFANLDLRELQKLLPGYSSRAEAAEVNATYPMRSDPSGYLGGSPAQCKTNLERYEEQRQRQY